MYHEQTYEQIRKRRTQRIVLALVAVLLLAALAVALPAFQRASVSQGAVTMRDSITKAAAQCCAVEGSYPSSLKHLEEHYGLVINHDDYAVNYEWLGDNVPPSVVVNVR